MAVNFMVIGDPHFRASSFVDGEELLAKCVAQAEKLKPDYIVVMGDILDSHDVAKNTPFKQACRFLEELSRISSTIALIGNHDLKNPKLFLSDDHFFYPYKNKVKRLIIVDRPYPLIYKDKKFIFCPFVPSGRFKEALDTLLERDDPVEWMDADCIFAHQDFAGLSHNGGVVEGDEWDENAPPIINGHIHNFQIRKNIYCFGTPMQIRHSEDPDKGVCLVTFKKNSNGLKYKRISLGIKGKVDYKLNYSELSNFDTATCDKYHVKLILRCTSEEMREMKKSKRYKELSDKGVKYDFEIIDAIDEAIPRNIAELSFEKTVGELVKDKGKWTQYVYREYFQVSQNEYFPETHQNEYVKVPRDNHSRVDQDEKTENLRETDINSEENIEEAIELKFVE